MSKMFFAGLGDTMFDGPTTLQPILAEHPFLKGMKDEHLALITGCASNVKFSVRWNTDSKPRYGSGWARSTAASTERRPASS